MADNTVTASGPTRGASYVLPWDTMAQYDQMVTATRDKFEAQNQQRLATIADMEKQDLTGMPSYDKALENHYEQLHGQIGKIITKYRDPFQSLEGMRELKDVQAKYIANPIVNNAKTTEDAYKRLQSDFAQNIITTDDYNIKKAEYDKHITEGDITKPFEYGRPDYMQSSAILDDVFKDMDKVILKESPNESVRGYSDEQFSQAVDLAMIGQHSAAFVREIGQNLQQQGVPVTEQSRQAEGIRLAKLYKPLDRNKTFHQASDGGETGGYMPFDNVLQTGMLSKEDVGSFIPYNAKTKGIEGVKILGRGPGEEEYAIPVEGSIMFFNNASSGVDIGQSQFADAEVIMPRQNIADGFIGRLQEAGKKAGISSVTLLRTIAKGSAERDKEGNLIQQSLNYIPKEKFDALAQNLGLKPDPQTGTYDFIANEFNEGKYQIENSFISMGDEKIIEKGIPSPDGKPLYSANAILMHLMSHGITKPTKEALQSSFNKEAMAAYYGDHPGTDWVAVKGAQIPLRVDITKGMEYNVSKNVPSGKTGANYMARAVKGENSFVGLHEGLGVIYSPIGTWDGIGQTDHRSRNDRLGKDSFGEILQSPRATASLIKGYNSFNSSTTTSDSQGKTKLEQLTHLSLPTLEEMFNKGGEQSFNATANAVLAKTGYDMPTKIFDQTKYDLLNFAEKGVFNMKKDLLKLQRKEIVSNVVLNSILEKVDYDKETKTIDSKKYLKLNDEEKKVIDTRKDVLKLKSR